MPFVAPERRTKNSETPESLFRILRRDKDGPEHLWAHQADLLRAYEKHVQAPDIALELPTGAGKTLVGMLIADWRRRRGERVLYLCPTKQLAHQAAEDARRSGIPVVDLTGSHTTWAAADKMAYDRCDAVAVAAYKAIFNSKSKLADAHVLVFDDAHSAAGEVLDAWTVTLRREGWGYQEVLAVCAEGLNPQAAARFAAGSEDPQDYLTAQLVDPRVIARHSHAIAEAIANAVEDTNEYHPWSMIRDHLTSCCVFIANDQVQIRPLLPPTGSHAPFSEARQRLYLSATLGDGAELERAFGRPSITRLPVPAGWDERGIGRRYFLFPELTIDAAQEDGEASVARFVEESARQAGRTLVIAPSERRLAQGLATYIPSDVPVIRAGDITASLSPFTKGPDNAVLALANRYDGIDLPGDACRLIVLDSLPIGADPHERFLAFTLGAKRVVQERMRTRLVQGAGRATRSANDYAAVIVLGRELVSFCGAVDAQAATHPEVRAELEFGIVNGQGSTLDNLTDTLSALLNRDTDDEWDTVAEPAIAALRDEPTTNARTDSLALASSARAEIRAAEAAWRSEWDRATIEAEAAIEALAGGAELRPYQALWNYLGGCWASFAAQTDPTYSELARQLLQAANSASRRTGWMPRAQDSAVETGRPETDDPHSPVDDLAAAALVRQIRQLGSRRAASDARRRFTEGLAAPDADAFEGALVALGSALGGRSAKPAGQARADAIWRWGDELWIAWEAKNEQQTSGNISAAAIRQANTHLRAAAHDLDQPIPPESFAVLCTPRAGIDPTVVPLADDSLLIVAIAAVEEIGQDTGRLWERVSTRILAGAADEPMQRATYDAMRELGVLPSGLRARLSGHLL